MISASYTVEYADSGRRLDQFLVEKAPALSRARLQDLIKAGHAQVNAGLNKPSYRLRAGDRVTLNEPAPVAVATEAQAIPLDILFEDEALLVINKSPSMVVHPAAGNWEGTLVNALLHHCQSLSGIGGERRPGIVHRLDKETSGCLVVAKHDAAHRSLARQFAGREITKIYLALCAGQFSAKSGVIEAPIARHPIHRKKMAVAGGTKGRSAKTAWRVLQELAIPGAEGLATLVECQLFTGRTHQIRVHLKHLGHPLLGDALYGKRGRFTRQMLHAWKLGFTHPTAGVHVAFTAPIPFDFTAAGISTPLPPPV